MGGQFSIAQKGHFSIAVDKYSKSQLFLLAEKMFNDAVPNGKPDGRNDESKYRIHLLHHPHKIIAEPAIMLVFLPYWQ